MKMNELEVLESAIKILNEHGWCQGNYEAPDGKVCAEGALIKAILGNSTNPMDLSVCTSSLYSNGIVQWNLYTRTICALRDHADENWECGSLFEYNDNPATTAEDIQLLFKRTIEDLKSCRTI